MVSFHTCPFLSPGEGKVGGMNVYIRQLAKHLGANGIKVDVFTRLHPEADQEEPEGPARVLHLEGIPRGAVMADLYSFWPQFLRHARRVSIEKKVHYNMVHSHYWLSGQIGYNLSLSWKVPHLITFHTLAKLKDEGLKNRNESPLRAPVENELMSKANAIVAFSQHEKDAMVRLYGASENKIRIVPSGVDLSLFHPLENSGPSARKPKENIILFVGRLEPLKGVDLLIRAIGVMKHSNPIKAFIIGGDKQGNELSRLRILVHELGLDDVVNFLGRIDQNKLPYYYSTASVTVVPSYYESFSMVALESLACGTPVVAFSVGGLSTLVQHGLTGYLVPQFSYESLATNLDALLSNPTLRQSMGRNARVSSKTMGWGNIARQVTKIYSSLNSM